MTERFGNSSYSEKALKASKGNSIYPQKISYWKLPQGKEKEEINMGSVNLLNVYNDAIYANPLNLAKAISSLDCWSEQQKEGWQKWDINRCRDDFLNAMHSIYESLNEKNDELEEYLVEQIECGNY
jgi:hypothetical protein